MAMDQQGVSEAVTHGIRVRVVPSYLSDQSDPSIPRYVFVYKIAITNLSERAVRLVSRRWRIVDADGQERLVEGDGVVGEQPVIEGGGEFVYSSACPLETPWGTMEGSYQMEDEESRPLDVAIARFYLVAPAAAKVPERRPSRR